LAETFILCTLTIQICLPVLAQSPLAVGNLEVQEGGSGIKTNFQVIFSLGPTYSDSFPSFSDTFQFTSNNAGQMFTISEATDTNFTTLASILTNGEPAFIGFDYWIGISNAGFGSGFEQFLAYFFDALPPGNNAVDFQGFPINNVSLLIDTLIFTSPGSNGDGNGQWTDFDFAGRLFVNGDPLLLSTNISETAEVGDSIAFPAFVASSAPLACQWLLNGSNSIGTATNILASGTNYLQITNAQLSDSGAYILVVSNNFGSVTSGPMVLSVIPKVAQRPVPAVYLTSQPGSSWTVLYSDTVSQTTQWTALAAATLTNNSQYYFDASAPLPQNRFYKAFQSGLPNVSSTLSLQTATAVTLTGNVGDTLRVDYINPFGPTNAWETAGTAILTNTTQLYFDVSTIGLPPRLYRITPMP
jgi:hypothetical protein